MEKRCYNFTIFGDPVGKQRPRVTQHGTYTPKKTKDYEELVKSLYQGPYFGDVPLCVDVLAVFPIPKSYTKKQRAECLGKPYMKKPDYDNILKIISDALNGVAYKDDNQIVSAYIYKRYTCEVNDDPRVTVILKEAELF